MRVAEAAAEVASSRSVLVVLGAGASTETGVPDFATLYREDPHLHSALSVRGHRAHPKSLARFLVRFSTRPSSGSVHRMLRLMRDEGVLLRCHTMNIDGIEGSVLPPTLVRYLHGRVSEGARCGAHRIEMADYARLLESGGLRGYERVRGCRARPNFALYGDSVAPAVEALRRDVGRADLVLCIGSRLAVEPVATAVREARSLLCVNAEPIQGVEKMCIARCRTFARAVRKALHSRGAERLQKNMPGRRKDGIPLRVKVETKGPRS